MSRVGGDAIGGVAVVAIGAGALWLSAGYRLGSLGRMGPGYFPVMLSVLLLALGAVITIAALRGDAAAMPRLRWGAATAVTAAVVTFAALLEVGGVVLATCAAVALLAPTQRPLRLVELGVFALALAAFVTLVFVAGLGIPMPVWPA